MTKYFFSVLLGLALITSCVPKNATDKKDALASHIDSTVNPGDDFFLYANGQWFKENPIPGNSQSNGVFQLVRDTISAQIRKICESSAKAGDKTGSPKQKIGDFYFSGMDSVSLNKKGISDLTSMISSIDGIKNKDDFAKRISELHAYEVAPLFNLGVFQDGKISNKNAVYVFQDGLSIPDRSYYVDNDETTKNIRIEFVKYAREIYKIMGYDDKKAATAADNLLSLETLIAKSSRKNEELRDPLSNYNKIPVSGLSALMPDFNWNAYLTQVGLGKADSVIVGQPEFLKAMNGLLKSKNMDLWKDYLKFHLVNKFADYLDDKIFMASFRFYSTTLQGIETPKPRWKRVVSQTNESLGELIGQVYVDEYLPKGTKEKLLEIGKAIKEVYKKRIQNLDWMSARTKEKALDKLEAMVMKVGYPDKWKDMSKLTLDRSSYVKNVMKANQWEFNLMISRYGKAVDRSEWDMQPQEYNAYYNPSNNEIVIPGCNIIVPGYERTLADDAILYSIIGGSIFGHEMTHGFDDQGCKFDKYGNLNNWWTKADSTNFVARTRKIIDQFSAYTVLDSLHLNGVFTQGENIADLAGIIMGFEAFKQTEQYKSKEKIAGFSPEQRFFLGYALAWMKNMRPESIAEQVRTDVHAPAQFRVNGPLSNIPEFYQAFGIKKGDKMWREDKDRVKIW